MPVLNTSQYIKSIHMKPLIMLTLILFILAVFCKPQIAVKVHTQCQTGFIYAPGITWTENKAQDSVIDIFIEGDTMTAVRNLLIYCMQEKNENDNAGVLLSMINLDHVKKLFNNKEFNFYLKEYRTAQAKNKKYRDAMRNKK